MADLRLTRANSTTSDTEESYYKKRRSFASGFTIEYRQEVLLWSRLQGGDDNYYQWMGNLPKVVQPNSTPSNSGGISNVNWVNVGNANYIEKLNSGVNSLSLRVTTLEQNPTGKSAYDSYVATTKDNPIKTEKEWVESLRGMTGSGLTIKGSFNSTADLPKNNNKPGDAYIIQEQMWVWDSVQWVVVGEQGPDGKSTYEIWLQAGNQGNISDFLLAQKGNVGDPGPEGSKGEKGDNAFALIFKGTLTDVNQLPNPSQGNLSWFYVINLEGYVSDGNAWIDIGNIRGPQGPVGPGGKDGTNGTDGKDGKDGTNGVDGQPGSKGDPGAPGADGAGIQIVDHLDDISQLPNSGTAGEAYLVGQDNELYVWLTGATNYTNVGKIAGQDGKDGKDGSNGKDGLGIQSSSVTYQSSTSGTVTPTGTWLNAVPAINPGEYLWTQTVFTLTDSSTVTGYSVAYQGKNGVNGKDGTSGTNGKDGVDGKDGLNGHSVSAKGYLNSISNLPTSNNNIADMYYVGGETYIWDGSNWIDMGTNIGPQGPAGPDGADGDPGQKGEQGSLWISLSGAPTAVIGREGDFYIDRDTNKYYQKTSSTQWSQLGTFGGGNVYDAPNDGIYYNRRNQAWVADPVQEAPNDGVQYARQNQGWSAIKASVPEAPSDGSLYARSNGAWVTFTPFTEAPTTAGQYFVRSAGAWTRLNRLDYGITSTTVTLDVSVSQYFIVDLSTARTLTLTNLPSGRGMPITIEFQGSGGIATYTNTINWTDGTAPSYKTTKTFTMLMWNGSSLTGFKPGGY